MTYTIHTISWSIRLPILAGACSARLATFASRVLRMSTQAGENVSASQSGQCGMQVVEEGSANVLAPSDVFYNPVQVFNRDLTMAVLNVFGKQYLDVQAARQAARSGQLPEPHHQEQVSGLRILEALAATGLRSIRIAKEVPRVARIVANDNSAEAVELIRANAARNGVAHLVEASHNDAVLLCHQFARLPYDQQFDVIDLDPYGSAVPFLDSAVQALRPGGLLCVTCTDTAVLCGSAFGTCYGRYGAVPYRGAGMHEAGLRILLQCIQSHASRHSRYIEPLLSLSVDFYMRVYLRLHRGQAQVKRIASKLSALRYCPECDTHALQPLAELGTDRAGQPLIRPARLSPDLSGAHCDQCGLGRPQLAGPLWSGAIHSAAFARSLAEFARSQQGSRSLATAERLVGLLSVAAEELPDVPLFYSLSGLARAVKCRTMPMRLARSALLNAGHRVSISHCDSGAVKTDAPAGFVWDLVRAYWSQFSVPVSECHLAEGRLPRALLMDRRPGVPTDGVSFELHPEAEPASKADGLLRFHVPPSNWGPKPRAKRKTAEPASAASTDAASASAASADAASASAASASEDGDSEGEAAEKKPCL